AKLGYQIGNQDPDADRRHSLGKKDGQYCQGLSGTKLNYYWSQGDPECQLLQRNCKNNIERCDDPASCQPSGIILLHLCPPPCYFDFIHYNYTRGENPCLYMSFFATNAGLSLKDCAKLVNSENN